MFKNQPKGLIPAALSNMGERFGYYIMNAVLVLFLCSKFGLSEETSALIYSFFYAGIYVLSLVGGLIADKTQNYKGTIIWGLIIMTLGYVVLAIPVFHTAENHTWLTAGALCFIAFGNGLFKGNLQAIVGQLYDNPRYSAQRDSGFQIFYVFINIGGLVAPFVAPMLRSWWLDINGMVYNASFPAMCHQFLSVSDSINNENINNLYSLATSVGCQNLDNIREFCSEYLKVFNTGIHFSFFASVAAMIISLIIFVSTKKGLPTPGKKEKAETVKYTAEERTAMAQEIRQRMYALFAVLGIAIFFWFSFHQNGLTLTLFAQDYTRLEIFGMPISAEIFQSANPICVVALTPIVIAIFAWLRSRGKEPSTPMKIAIGMGIAAAAYVLMVVGSLGLPGRAEVEAMGGLDASARVTPWLLVATYLILTVAELFISPLGLSFVSKVAPQKLQGLMQGCWLGATALGNGLLFIGPILYKHISISATWAVFVTVCGVSMLVMLAMVKWLERVTE